MQYHGESDLPLPDLARFPQSEIGNTAMPHPVRGFGRVITWYWEKPCCTYFLRENYDTGRGEAYGPPSDQ
jgi:hypothetical protein